MNNIFTYETFQAFHGDCSMIHFGNEGNEKLMVIDGGPGKIYRKFLRKRLLEIRNTKFENDSLPIELMMVSHIDDDHIKGLEELLREIKEDEDEFRNSKYKIKNFWCNTFDDIIGNKEITDMMFSIQTNKSEDKLIKTAIEGRKVIASTNQGRAVRDYLRALKIRTNNNAALVTEKLTTKIDDLKLNILLPNEKRLLELQKRWDEELKKAIKKGDKRIILASINKPDRSPFNLASIVCLVEFQNKKILLTGDARSDDILKSLQKDNLLVKGTLEIDILKVPHHGSDRNLSAKFFSIMIAKHYIFSADGKHGNPDLTSLKMLLDGTKLRDDFTVHFTNDIGKEDLATTIAEFRKMRELQRRKFKISILPPNQGSFKINLINNLAY